MRFQVIKIHHNHPMYRCSLTWPGPRYSWYQSIPHIWMWLSPPNSGNFQRNFSIRKSERISSESRAPTKNRAVVFLPQKRKRKSQENHPFWGAMILLVSGESNIISNQQLPRSWVETDSRILKPGCIWQMEKAKEVPPKLTLCLSKVIFDLMEIPEFPWTKNRA